MSDLARQATLNREPSATMRPGALRYFLAVLSLYYVVVAVVGFTPSYIDYSAGRFVIDPIVHVHGALMACWLGLFATQTYFAATGKMDYHRALGLVATGLAALIWTSMWVVSVHALQRAKFPQEEFLLDVLAIQLAAIAQFAFFFIWGFLARRTPDFHKRLMILATLILLQASLDRMSWLPSAGFLGQPGLGYHGIRLYVFALSPLFVFDILSIKRIHPVTLIGTGVIVVVHAIVGFLWGNPVWRALAHTAVAAIR